MRNINTNHYPQVSVLIIHHCKRIKNRKQMRKQYVQFFPFHFVLIHINNVFKWRVDMKYVNSLVNDYPVAGINLNFLCYFSLKIEIYCFAMDIHQHADNLIYSENQFSRNWYKIISEQGFTLTEKIIFN